MKPEVRLETFGTLSEHCVKIFSMKSEDCHNSVIRSTGDFSIDYWWRFTNGCSMSLAAGQSLSARSIYAGRSDSLAPGRNVSFLKVAKTGDVSMKM